MACNARHESTSGASPSATPSGAASSTAARLAPAAAARARELLAAEHRRDSRAITLEDLSHRDVSVRRAAARALARIADKRAKEQLLRSLADEDAEIVAWSSYGLGFGCRESEPEIVRALTARAASLAAQASPPAEPLRAVADALGRCGSSDAERTLRSWLAGTPELSESAAAALGQIASRRGRLDDASLVALLDASGRPSGGPEQALFAFTRLSTLGPSVRARLLEVAKGQLAAPGARGALAVRALGNAGEEAAPLLGEVLKNPKQPAPSRAEAARSLGRLGEAGQRELTAALPVLLSGSDQTRVTAEQPILLALLDALTTPLAGARDTLAELRELPVPDAPAQRRRAVALRCRAASLLAGRATASRGLRECDPDANGREGALAMLAVLDRGKIEGPRAQRFRELVESKDVVVRERALGLLGGHPEAPEAPKVLAAALAAKTPGNVAVAAQTLAKYPERAGSPDPAVIAALTQAFESAAKTHALETRAALMDAAAALQLLGLKSRLEAECKSEFPSLREHAQNGLRLLGERERNCIDFTPSTAAPEELGRLLGARTRLELETDAGTLSLTLNPDLAPVAVTRVVELARQGFYDGTSVHRVVPGFVAQFGDPAGDGYGGAPRPPLRCETAPVPFQKFSVGVALAGRDTGSSQLFVSLGRFPHLDGEYTLVGDAEGPWDSVVEGDVIRKVRVNASR